MSNLSSPNLVMSNRSILAVNILLTALVSVVIGLLLLIAMQYTGVREVSRTCDADQQRCLFNPNAVLDASRFTDLP